jgi:hypothetical protein
MEARLADQVSRTEVISNIQALRAWAAERARCLDVTLCGL